VNNAILIFLAVVVISAIIGGLAQVLKNVQKAEETRTARARAAHRERSNSRSSGSGDIDRFLEEIDKLRRRGGVEPPVARPAAAPVAAPVRTRVIDRPPLTPPARPLPSSRLDELPMAPVVASTPAVARRAAPPGRTAPPPRSEFARGLSVLLKSSNALPTAVVLQEILGPPKWRRI
jgi:hypothetical protein